NVTVGGAGTIFGNGSGSFAVSVATSDTKAYVSNSSIHAWGDIDVTADDESFALVVGGAINVAVFGSGGLAIAVNVVEKTTH
ncbi:MAG: hypothetical protein ABW140_17960, partial [Candidatus Sedimenticola sp. 6PFRAG1]